MRGTLLAFALALAAGGCSAETLDAGSTAAAVAAKPTTRATLHVMVDAVTMDADALYFTCEDGWLYRLERSGTSPPERLARCAAPGSLYTEGIAVDDAYVYWTALGDGLDDGEVLRAPKTGGAVTRLAPKQARPWGIALDGGAVVWAEQGAPAEPSDGASGIGRGSILRLEPGEGAPRVLASALDAPDFLVVDAEGGVTWHEAAAIRRVARGGGAPTTLLERPVPFRSTDLVVDGDGVAWADAPAGVASVWSAGASRSVIALAEDVEAPASLASAGGEVFWDVATGADVGAIFGARDGGAGPRAIAGRDGSGSTKGERAIFLLADARAFYSVTFSEARGLTVEIRALAR